MAFGFFNCRLNLIVKKKYTATINVLLLLFWKVRLRKLPYVDHMHCTTFTCIMQVKKFCCYAFKEYSTYESTINRYCSMITMLFQSVLIVIPYRVSYAYLPGTPQLSVYIFIWCKVLNSLDRVKLAISTTLTIRKRENDIVLFQNLYEFEYCIAYRHSFWGE